MSKDQLSEMPLKSFTQKHMRNLRRGDSEKDIFCTVREERFVSSISLPCHLQNYGSVPFKCHLKAHCNNQNKEFVDNIQLRCYFCEICNYKTDRSSNIKRHLLIHTQECPFTCNVCGKAFNQKANLKTHCISKHYQ